MKKKLLSILDYLFFNRTLFLEWTVKYCPIPSYFNWLYSIWNKRRRKAFQDPLRWGTLKNKKKALLFFEFTLFLFRTPVDSKTSHFNYPFKFYLLSFAISSLKVPPNKTRINSESWFFKESFPSFIPDYLLFYFLFIRYYAN